MENESDFKETTSPSDQIELFEDQIKRIQNLIDHPERFIDWLVLKNHQNSLTSADLIEIFQGMMDERRGLTVSLKD